MGEEGDGRPDMVNRDPNTLNENLMVSAQSVPIGRLHILLNNTYSNPLNIQV